METLNKERTTEELKKEYLPNKIVYLKPVPGKDLTLTKKDKESAHSFMYEDAIVEKCLPMDERMNYYNPFKDEQERKFFEEITGKNLALDYTSKDCAWNTGRNSLKLRFQVTQAIKAFGYSFDLSKPYDNLKYKIAKMQPDIAESLSEALSRPNFVWYLSDGEEEAQVESKAFDVNMKLYMELGSIRASKEKMSQLLQLYYMEFDLAKAVPKDITTNALESEIQIIIRDNGPKLLKVLEDPDKDIKILIYQGVEAGAIEKSGANSYHLSGSSDIEPYLEFVETIKHFKNIKNTDDTYGVLLQRIQKASKRQ